jgi:hypothetical protein
VASDRLALRFEKNGTAFFELYGRSGPVGYRSGMASGSELLAMDANYVWYTVWDTPATRRLMRSQWYDLGNL